MTRKGIGLACLVLLVAGMLAACGASMESGASYDSMVVEEMAVEREAASQGWDESAKNSAPTSPGYDGEIDDVQVERMIIWNADISLTVEDTREAITSVHALARELGGYTTATDTWNSDDQPHARVTIRVPAERFEEAMSRLRDLALKVERESANSEDVTDQYVDLESRLRHLEAKETQLLKFLDGAEDTEAALAVYDHLAETQGEIELVKGRMDYLEKLAALATISVDISPEASAAPIVEEGWRPGHTLRDAARSLVGTLEVLGDAVIWFIIYLLPVLLVLAVPIGLVVWLLVRRRRKRKSQQE